MTAVLSPVAVAAQSINDA